LYILTFCRVNYSSMEGDKTDLDGRESSSRLSLIIQSSLFSPITQAEGIQSFGLCFCRVYIDYKTCTCIL